MKRRVNKSQSNHNNIKINTNSININFNNNKKQCPICTKYFDNNEISDICMPMRLKMILKNLTIIYH